MSAVYVETSALLSWLLGEPSGAEVGSVLAASDEILSSVLTFLETRRALIRAQTEKLLTESEVARFRGIVEILGYSWHLLGISPEVRERASSPFPIEPIRSLDAIHLATALVFAQAFSDIRVLSFDRRITENLTPLGLA